MSQTTICVASADGVMQRGRAFRNAWGGAWFIWDALWRKYCREGDLSVLTLANEREREALWQLDRDERLLVDERIALISTFDYCLIHRQDALRVADAFDAFVTLHERRRTGRACSLPLQAIYLRELAQCPEVREIGWWQQSVSPDPWWFVREVESSHGETQVLNDEPYNLNKGHSHWFLFDRYPELKQAGFAGVPLSAPTAAGRHRAL